MKKKRNDGIVYSTNPSWSEEQHDDENTGVTSPGDHDLRVHLEKKHRGGKTVTLVTGFEGNDDELADLGKLLRNKCGTGGSAKDGLIIIQGDMREKVLKILADQGYRAKRGGG